MAWPTFRRATHDKHALYKLRYLLAWSGLALHEIMSLFEKYLQPLLTQFRRKTSPRCRTQFWITDSLGLSGSESLIIFDPPFVPSVKAVEESAEEHRGGTEGISMIVVKKKLLVATVSCLQIMPDRSHVGATWGGGDVGLCRFAIVYIAH